MKEGYLSSALRDAVDNQKILTATFKIGSISVDVGSTPLTPQDFNFVNRRIKTNFQSEAENFDGQIEMLIRKAKVREGEVLTSQPVFTLADKPLMQRLGVEQVGGMFADLFSGQVEAVEDEEGDLAGN